MTERSVTARLPDEVVEEIDTLSSTEGTNRSEQIRRLIRLGLFEKKLDRAADMYRKRRMSLPRLARYLGVTLWEAVELLKERRVEAQYSMEDLRRDMAETDD